jgi:hypothetical protein
MEGKKEKEKPKKEEKQGLMRLKMGMLYAGNAKRRVYKCRFVKAGRVRAAGNRPSNLEIMTEALSTACEQGMFDNKAVFIDHAGWFENPSIRDLAGVTAEAVWNPGDQSVDGKIKFYQESDWLTRLIDEMLEEGEKSPDIGLSIVFWPEFEESKNENDPRKIVGIRHVESVDLVFEPAADGRLLEALSTRGKIVGDCIASLRAQDARKDMNKSEENQSVYLQYKETEEMEEEFVKVESPEIEKWVHAVGEQSARAMIGNSDLPAASKERLSEMAFKTPDEVKGAIEAEHNYLAKLAEASVVKVGGIAPRSPHISMGLTGFEQVEKAVDALIMGGRPPEGIAPLTGVRELYTLMSGDYEMTGLFHADRVTLANVNCSTMAGLVANALNKRVVNLFQEYPRWWDKIVYQEDFTNLQQVKWITLGGVGELPTVAEGAAYTELTWDDQTETADFVKKGGYLGLTIEAIDKDDTRKIQAAPRALAQAAWLTLNKSISAIFTANSGVGPTMSDSDALFHTNHSNLTTTALSHAQWHVVRLAMRKQTELNSSERLGALTAPKYCLVPPDLELTALQIFATQETPGSEYWNANPASEGDERSERLSFARDRVIVVDLWTDVNDWAAVADPNLYPSIGLAFRYGRTPEIYSVASPTAGLMFTNDTMPIKVRFFFATGPTDWRGLHKANV